MVEQEQVPRSRVLKINPRTFAREIYHMLPASVQPHVLNLGRRVVRGLERRASEGKYPLSLHIETTTSCARTCWYCPREPHENIQLEEETFERIIYEVSKWPYSPSLVLAGYGEPLMDKRIFDFVSYAREKLPRADISIPTNGDLLDEEFLKKLITSGLNHIRVSFHEPSDEASMERLTALRNKYPLFMSVVDMRDGYRKEPLFNRAGSIIDVGPIQHLKRCDFVEEMNIRADGKVVLCCHDWGKTKVLGNVHDSSLLEIWNNDKYKKLRQEIRRGNFTLDICKSCGFQQNILWGAIERHPWGGIVGCL